MRTMQLTEENIGEVLRLLAGVLHTGNIEFMTAGGAQVSSKSGETQVSLQPGWVGGAWLTGGRCGSLSLQLSVEPRSSWAWTVTSWRRS